MRQLTRAQVKERLSVESWTVTRGRTLLHWLKEIELLKGLEVPPVAAISREEDKDPNEDTEEDKDPEESDDIIVYEDSPEPIDPEDFDPWDYPDSDLGFNFLFVLGLSNFAYIVYVMSRPSRNVHPELKISLENKTSRLLKTLKRLEGQNMQQQ
ncbi:hypothetical protein FNV43_RR21614 [Rhamnella rubrinervis]|uniref:Uncharacterized protein n=1 Tax=Rhamnella rubrinervis TaxID=2594499 RepID=A0A8K0GQA1_9ROSA|nr:hypothetical protein FNV43_RR21614 [Rhamnella rubrinervis]